MELIEIVRLLITVTSPIAMMLKVPQVLKIYRGKSVAGISFISFFYDYMSLLTKVCAYVKMGMAMYAFTDLIFISLQNVILVMMHLYYTGASIPKTMIVFMPSICLMSLTAYDYIPNEVFSSLVA